MLQEKQPKHPSSYDLVVSFGPSSEDLTSGSFSKVLFELNGEQTGVSHNPAQSDDDLPLNLEDACLKLNKQLLTNKIYKEAFLEANAKINELNQIIAIMKEQKKVTSQLGLLHISGIAQDYESNEDSMFLGNLMQAKPKVNIFCADCPEKERRVEILKMTIEDLQRTVDMLKTQLKKTKEVANSNEEVRGAPKLLPILNPKEPDFTKKRVDSMRQERVRLPESEESAAYQRIIKPLSGMQLLKEDFSRIPLKAGKIRAMSACAAWLDKEMLEL